MNLKISLYYVITAKKEESWQQHSDHLDNGSVYIL